MKLLIPTIGTRGDVQPYIALASSRQDAGHRATVATHPFMRGLVEGGQIWVGIKQESAK
jgi:sterol 3beta-glucosyltransferase